MPRRARRKGFSYRLLATLLKPPLLLMASREWSGQENVPESGGFVAAINHNSYLDPLSYAHFQYNTGAPPRFLVKDGLFKNPVLGRVLRAAGQIPVYRGTANASGAYRAAVDAVRAGECVAVYPEATLTRDPDLWPMAGKTGAARIALETGAPVIPVAQWGAAAIMPPYGKGGYTFRLRRRGRFTVVAGKPVDLSAFAGREVDAETLRAATDVILDAITELLAGVRGERPPATRFDLRAAQDAPPAPSPAPSADRATAEPADGAGQERGR